MFGKKWNPDGKHVYITGGSAGLGLAMAQIFVSKGAHVSIVARSEKKLEDALKTLEERRVSPSQIIKSYSFSLDSVAGSSDALDAASKPFEGQAPDLVLACAGSSKPLFFVDMTEEDMVQGMKDGYWVQAWTAFAAAKKMAKQRRKGAKIVLVASTLAYMSFLGWASYAPAKHALRGLADTLRSEMLLYGVDVQLFIPPSMSSPGFDEENKRKPEIVKKIEGVDDVFTPEAAAIHFYKGIVNGDAHIAGDWISILFRASTRGATPVNNSFLDPLYDLVAFIAMPIWRRDVDRQVIAHRAEHEEYLKNKGFFS